MPLDPRILNCVVRISSGGDLRGSGSIVSVPSEAYEGSGWPYVVTAHHVISNQVGIEIEVPNPEAHGQLFARAPCDDWRQPISDVDLAIAPLPLEQVPFFQATSLDEFVPSERGVPPGGEIIYLGVFAPLEVPMARGGTLGAHDVPIDKPDYRYHADLVDCRSYGGFSGSPCFSLLHYAVPGQLADLGHPQVPRQPGGSPIPLNPIASVAAFCGIFTAHYTDESHPQGVVSHYGVGVMLPCDYVRDALLTYQAANERHEWDQTRKPPPRRELPPIN
jgi:hypothetical protein